MAFSASTSFSANFRTSIPGINEMSRKSSPLFVDWWNSRYILHEVRQSAVQEGSHKIHDSLFRLLLCQKWKPASHSREEEGFLEKCSIRDRADNPVGFCNLCHPPHSFDFHFDLLIDLCMSVCSNSHRPAASTFRFETLALIKPGTYHSLLKVHEFSREQIFLHHCLRFAWEISLPGKHDALVSYTSHTKCAQLHCPFSENGCLLQ